MRIGVRVPSFLLGGIWRRGEYLFEKYLETAYKAGFDGVEITTPYPLSKWLSESEIYKMVKSLEDYGLEAPSLSADWMWVYSIYHRRFNDWLRCGLAANFLEGELKFAEKLNVKVILLHLGSSMGSWAEAKKILTELSELAGKYRIKLGFESNSWPYTGLGDIRSLVRMVDEIKSKWFGVYLHYSDGNSKTSDLAPHEEIELVGERIVCLHSSGISFNTQIDYEKLLRALKKYYNWYWIFEVPKETFKRNLMAIRHLLKMYW
ncbi:sugar phosphate isomerase/epimerase [Candidatus Bathyarchaeota archaeon]|nr:MAG: sugar phosphate isomerase/epimerase [Candidatus Bathyarchaeota archaeon]